MKKKYLILNIFLILGMLIALFLVYEHFSESASEFCSFGASLDCGIVNKSPYANLDGISYLLTIDFGLNLPFINIAGINPFFDFLTSNAFLGFLTLVLMFFLARANYKNKEFLFIKRDKTINWMLAIAMFGVAYGFYLFLIQHFVLKTYCIFCLGLDITLIGQLITIILIKNGKKKR